MRVDPYLRRIVAWLPFSGNPTLQAFLERESVRQARRAGYLVARILDLIAPQVDPAVVARSFMEGLEAGRHPTEEPRGRVFRFPGR